MNNEENLDATTPNKTTVPGVDMNADDWFEQASKHTNAAEGNDYVKLDRGLLTVNQLNFFLKTIPIELTYADENNQFIYYNKFLSNSEMLAPRTPDQVGNPLSAVHPERAVEHVKHVIHALREGETDLISMPVPGNGPTKHVMHYYKAMHDEEGNYRGINEWVADIWPVVESYLKMTGQKLVPDPDATTGPSVKPQADTQTGASKHE